MKSRLKRENQCKKCPWRVSTKPNEIPNGYSLEAHKKLKSTITTGLDLSNRHVMSCHEENKSYCIGWFHNQMGIGNNIRLRLKMINYDLSRVKVFGKQHDVFEETYKEKIKKAVDTIVD